MMSFMEIMQPDRFGLEADETGAALTYWFCTLSDVVCLLSNCSSSQLSLLTHCAVHLLCVMH